MLEQLMVSVIYVLPSVLIGFLITYFFIFLLRKITKVSLPKMNYLIGFIIIWAICTMLQVVSLFNIFTGSILLIPIVLSLLIIYILYLSKKTQSD